VPSGEVGRDRLTSLVHDLRTPLAVVVGFAELLERRAAELSDEQRAEYVRRIAEGATQMNEILERAGDEPA
jgi:K+-sensing histidine kinase KdpD